MSVEQNAALIKLLYTAFGQGDLKTVAALIDDHAIWKVPGRSPISGVYEGKTAVFDYFERLRELSQGTFRVTLKDAAGLESGGVAIADVTGSLNGKTYHNTYCLLCQIKEGKICEARLFNEDQYAFDEFWVN